MHSNIETLYTIQIGDLIFGGKSETLRGIIHIMSFWEDVTTTVNI